MVERVECAVIGAGAVGLAIARALARDGHEVVILEAEGGIGTGISSRSSEVIHAGMYYPAGSLKARYCAPGNLLLREFLASHGVPFRMVGKLIIATDEDEERTLAGILARGRVNGCTGLRQVDPDWAIGLEPQLNCTAALFSPDTGIFDSHGYMLALLGDAQAEGAQIAFHAPVEGGAVTGDGIELAVGGPEPLRLCCLRVVNAAGLGANRVAARLDGLAAAHVPPLYFCKGNYFAISGRQPFARLVYPVPEASGLGVHYTLDLGGQGRFGPDTEWIGGEEDYEVDPHRCTGFYEVIRRYWPGLPDDALRPAYAGIRPKLQAEGEPARDFVISGPAEHGVPGLVNLFGIESPGLTSSLPIADEVAGLLQ